MLIRNRSDFDKMLNSIQHSGVIVYDTEGEGVNLRHGDKTIGLSVYIPSTDQSFYFAWGHGLKEVDRDPDQYKRWSYDKKRARAYQVYFDKFQSETLKENAPIEWLDELKQVWTPDKLYIGHNLQYDLTALHLLGFPTPNRIADTLAMLSVVNPDWLGKPSEGLRPRFLMPDTDEYEYGSRGLKWQSRLWGLADAKAGIESLDDAAVKLFKKLSDVDGNAVIKGSGEDASQKYLWMLKPSDVAKYAEDDTRLTYALYQKLLKWSEKWNDSHLFDLYNASILNVWTMNLHGFRFDSKTAEKAVQEEAIEQERLVKEIERLSGGVITSPNSSQQIIKYLSMVGVKVDKANKDTLANVKLPIVNLIQSVKRSKKVTGTYIETWLQNHVNGYVHPEINVGAAGTGRSTSSSEMFGNFQNIPRVSTQDKYSPKGLLYPPEGHILIDIDYQALEMRLVAWVAEWIIGKGKDTTLTRMIEEGTDMHGYTLEVSGVYNLLLNGRTESKYLRDNGYSADSVLNTYRSEKGQEGTQEEADKWYYRSKIARYYAKTTNFAAVYGAGVRGIMKAVKCSEDEARVLLNGYHKAYPAVKPALDFMQSVAVTPRKLPNSNEMGLYIHYPIQEIGLYRKYNWYDTEKHNGYSSDLERAARGALNSVVQGTGGLMMFNSINRIKERFGFTTKTNQGIDYSSGLVTPHITVHDSAVISLRPCDLHIVPEIVKLMCDYPTRPVIKAEVAAAPLNGSWGEVQNVKNLDKWIKSGGSKGFDSDRD
jgi:DNA polymerase I-like protein with 3'-5' exonuclease and polymerase domains